MQPVNMTNVNQGYIESLNHEGSQHKEWDRHVRKKDKRKGNSG